MGFQPPQTVVARHIYDLQLAHAGADAWWIAAVVSLESDVATPCAGFRKAGRSLTREAKAAFHGNTTLELL